jgi:outer membrane receptor protein involved in Fe transport
MAKQTDPASVSNTCTLKPIPLGIRNHFVARRASVAAATLLSSTVAFGQASDLPMLEEIVVTAQKREQNLQDVPIAIQVLDTQRLEDLGIKGFDDYVFFLPSVSMTPRGPGQSQIYMRGCSDGGDGNFSGTNPSTAIYVDEQPVTSISRNLDYHIYDIARIEAIAGPQGTLYGASSQCGTIRILSNAPSTEGFAAGYDLGANGTKDGDPGYSAEGFVNFAITDNTAIRLVGWYVEDGGWIDNVPASLTFTNQTDPATGMDFVVQNSGNADPAQNVVEDDVNSTTKQGLRALLGIDLSDNWALGASIKYQKLENDGFFGHKPQDPTVGAGNVDRYFQDRTEDEATLFNVTLDGDFDWGDVVLSASYMDRDVQYDTDYSAYAEYSSYVPLYYTCDYGTYYNCVDPRIQYEQDSNYKRTTLEGRLTSSGDGRLNWVGGLFYDKEEHDYFNRWHIPTIDGTARGFFGTTLTGSVTGPINPSIWNVQGETDLYFATNQQREREEIAIFGEISYAFTDKLTGLIGARFFETDDSLTGGSGGLFGFGSSSSDCAANGIMNNLPRNPLFPSDPPCGAGIVADESDNTWKFNLTYSFTGDVMGFVTYSQGWRPGGANRLSIPTAGIGNTYDSDTVDNYEIGVKTTLADGRVRLNATVYLMEWSDIQLTTFDPTVSLLGLTANTADAEMTGLQVDFDWLITENWNLVVNAAWNQSELTEDYTRQVGGAVPDAPDGTDLPFAPDLKYTILSRYTFNNAGLRPYVQASWVWTDDQWNTLFVSSRALQDSYGFLNASAGIQRNGWVLEVYGNNLTDEDAELFKYTYTPGDNPIITNRPINYGVRFRQRF